MSDNTVQRALFEEWIAREYGDFGAPYKASMLAAWEACAADYEEVLAEHRRLVRELDVLFNGEAGLVAQVRNREDREAFGRRVARAVEAIFNDRNRASDDELAKIVRTVYHSLPTNCEGKG